MITALLITLLAQTFPTLKVQPDRVVMITAPRPRPVARVLVHFPLDSTVCRQIMDALLEFRSPASPSTGRRLLLQIVPITTAWDSGEVSWTEPWTTPGGDYDATVARFLALPSPGERVQVDLTLFVRNCDRYHGILVKPPAFRGVGFGDAARYLTEALKNATLILTLRPGEASSDTLHRRKAQP